MLKEYWRPRGRPSGWASTTSSIAGATNRADEHLATMRELWEERACGRRLGVRPLTTGGPEARIGGDSDAALRRVLRYGHGWHGSGVDAAALTGVRQRLATPAKDTGRDPDTLALTAGTFPVPPGFSPAVDMPWRPLGGDGATADSVNHELGLPEQAGLASCSLGLPVAAEALPDALAWVGQEVLPAHSKG